VISPCEVWLCSLPQLVELDLRGTTIPSEETLVGVLQHLTGLTKLKIFDANHYMLNDQLMEGTFVCKTLSRMTALRSLSINGVARICSLVLNSNVGRALHGMTQLFELYVGDDRFCDEI